MNKESQHNQPNHSSRHVQGAHSEPVTAKWQYELLQNHLSSELSTTVTTATTKLKAQTLAQPPVMWRKLANGSSDSTGFVLLPRGAEKSISPRWAIRLEALTVQATPPGIILASDVVIGMSRPLSPQPDLDLAPYDGHNKGVSRRHAMIRPSTRHLYLLDLQSSNGTCVNGLRTPSGTAAVLQDGDLISFGALTFQLHILATPEDFE